MECSNDVCERKGVPSLRSQRHTLEAAVLLTTSTHLGWLWLLLFFRCASATSGDSWRFQSMMTKHLVAVPSILPGLMDAPFLVRRLFLCFSSMEFFPLLGPLVFLALLLPPRLSRVCYLELVVGRCSRVYSSRSSFRIPSGAACRSLAHFLTC